MWKRLTRTFSTPTFLFDSYTSWGKTEKIAHVLSPPSGIAQKISSRVTLLPYIRPSRQLSTLQRTLSPHE